MYKCSFSKSNIFFILLVYLIFTVVFITQKPAIYSSVINPIFWGILIILSIINIRKSHILICKNKKLTTYMIIISSVHIVLYFYTGFIFGFSKSPYNHSFNMILKNTFTQIIPIISIEILRYIVIFKNKNNKKDILLITVLLILLEINYNTLISVMHDRKEFFIYACSDIVPLISYSVLFAYLAIINSFILPIIFRIFSEMIVILLEILPNINWFAKGTACMLSATLTYILFKYKFLRSTNVSKQNKTPKIYVITLVFLLTLILFMLGFFKYKPIAVMSNSMYPTYSRGDIIIYKKVSEEEIKDITEDTILIYSIRGQNIAHRVVNIINNSDGILIQTKGDSNNSVDTNLVTKNQIKGVYIFHIKYLGFPAIWFNEFLNAKK